MAVWLETDVPVTWPCSTCAGRGEWGPGPPIDRDWCHECGGTGCDFAGPLLATLCHNLAIAGALCVAFRFGDNFGHWIGRYGKAPAPWQPNVYGKPAPGTPTRGER